VSQARFDGPQTSASFTFQVALRLSFSVSSVAQNSSFCLATAQNQRLPWAFLHPSTL
jgi:hypothetical protein